MKGIILLVGLFFLFISANAQESIIVNDKSLSQPVNNLFESPLPFNHLNPGFSKTNFIAIYNSSTMTYCFYPSNVELNFNLYSPRAANHGHSPVKMDSFNPYGTNKPQVSVMLGVIDFVFKKIQN